MTPPSQPPAEPTALVDSFQQMLQGLARYDFTPNGMVASEQGHYVEWVRLPWSIIMAIGRVGVLEPLRASGLSDEWRELHRVLAEYRQWGNLGTTATTFAAVSAEAITHCDRIAKACDALLDSLRVAPVPLPKGAGELWPAEFFCAQCLAPKRSSYRALGAMCEAGCGNTNDGSDRKFWLHRSELPAPDPVHQEQATDG